MSRVDVIIPCYKYGHFLRACVESVLNQEGVDVRALILDDASPDHTPEVAAELTKQDYRVEYRRHAVNRGHIATFNEGLEWLTGDYGLLLSADDLLVPGALARASQLMDAHPDVGMCFGREQRFQNESELSEIPECGTDYTWRILSGREFLEISCASAICFVQTCTAVVRSELQKRIGGYRAELPHAGDMEMWLRFAVNGAIGKLDCVQGCYRQHEHNMSTPYFGTPLRDLYQRRLVFDLLFEYGRDRIGGWKRLEQCARRALGEPVFWAAFNAFEQGDLAACRDYLSFAETTYPELRSWPCWSRMQWKLRLGPRLWSFLRPMVTRVRRGSQADSGRGGKAAAERKKHSLLVQ